MHAIPMILKNTAVQFAILFGSFFVMGLVLSWLARLNNNVFNQFRFRAFGLYVFGAIGVTVHELSHAFFCRVFFHEIKSIKLFDPKGSGGAQGAVTHTYEPWNPYHRVGHYFIGLGPALLGPFIIAVLFYALIPAMRASVLNEIHSTDQLMSQIALMAHWLVQKANFTSWRFWVFSYLATCIATQIELSHEDLKQAKIGCIPLFLILLLANVIAWAAGLHLNDHLMHFGTYLISLVASIFVLAALLSLINLIAWSLILGLCNRLLGRQFINPFHSA